MMLTRPLEHLTAGSTEQFGGKTVALARLRKLGYQVPASLAITTDAYRHYLAETGLESHILMELGRKDFQQMRWEEIWDAALRIRNLFLTTPFPASLEAELAQSLSKAFNERPLVIRSSAPGEDASGSSFAGLHDSYVNVYGRQEQLLAVRKVWASLWSDRALLYRQELALSLKTSSMAVLVQEVIESKKSGVAFSRSPTAEQCVGIEAVYGFNQGLVDGSVEPDFWAWDRSKQIITDFRAAPKKTKLAAISKGLQLVPLSNEEINRPVLTSSEVATIAQTALALEQSLGSPQDLEWTWTDNHFFLLQARPITTDQDKEDPRRWYISLRRNFENLKQLKVRIEEEIIPGMEAAAEQFANFDLSHLSDQDLAKQIERRRQAQIDWEEAYRSDCIPMAHGIRLFGEFYNDAIQPDDPFEFVELLRGEQLKAVTRNQQLKTLAMQVAGLRSTDLTPAHTEQLKTLAKSIGLSSDLTMKLLHEMAKQPNRPQRANKRLEEAFLQHFPAEELPQAQELLAIGRASYQLRDDDNISLDKINYELKRAEQEAEQRLRKRKISCLEATVSATSERIGLSSPPLFTAKSELGQLKARQLQGQPASAGLATAAARVIRDQEDLADFQRGEILVCDAIDPAMTFVVPLAAGIIERRGGMLIHGAIIAREYGIPCVSGIAAAADIINTGDMITVDGYLGLIFFSSASGKLTQPTKKHLLRKELDDARGDSSSGA